MKKTGFTLIEILVVTAIMLVLLGGGIASYINFNERQRLISSAREVQGLLRSAQVKARAGQRPEACQKLEKYQVRSTDNNSLALVAICSGNLESEVIVSQVDLDSSVTLSSDISVNYLVLHGGVEGEGEIDLLFGDNRQYTFMVDEGGAVSEGAIVEIEAQNQIVATPTPPVIVATPTPTPTPTPTVQAPTPLPTGLGGKFNPPPTPPPDFNYCDYLPPWMCPQ